MEETVMKKSPNGKFLQRFIPARFVFVFLGFFAFNLVYAYKVVLSMTIIAMTYKVRVTNFTEKHKNDECPMRFKPDPKIFPGYKFNWNDEVESEVIGAFFYGFILTQIPAGIAATLYGGKWIIGVALFFASLLSLASPWSAKVDYRCFMALRIVQGLCVGVSLPCINTMIAQWMPKMERTRGNSVIGAGTMIGTFLTLPLSALLSESDFLGSWEATFYLLGVAGVVWFALWCTLVYESPESHPFISQQEFDYILANDGGKKKVEVSGRLISRLNSNSSSLEALLHSIL